MLQRSQSDKNARDLSLWLAIVLLGLSECVRAEQCQVFDSIVDLVKDPASPIQLKSTPMAIMPSSVAQGVGRMDIAFA